MERQFTVATFVVDGEKVLMLKHRKLGMWLPPGGHIEPGELPDEAAVREVLEETGIYAELLPESGEPAPPGPVRLCRPEAVQLEDIAPGHQHIDMVYFARPVPGSSIIPRPNEESSAVGWFGPGEMARLGANEEILHWISRAVSHVKMRDRGAV